MSFILANYKKQNENYQIADSQDFQATTYSDGYKKTSELTNADLSDAYQKNYQEASEADGSYLYKSAEWTNKQDGEGLITIKGKQVQELEDTSALYVGTMCYAHGLTEDILVKNISTLIKFYDRVDFVAINTSREKGIIEAHSFTPESTEDEIRTYVSETKASGEEYPHYTNSVPAAIEKYLFGNLGDEYVSEENLVNNPTAIYVSCDSFFIDNVISDGWIWGTEYAIEKYFNFNDDKQTWFDKIKDLAEEMGYAREVKEYKQNPENWKGHVGDISTVLRVALTKRQQTPDLYEIMQVLGKSSIEKRIALFVK